MDGVRSMEHKINKTRKMVKAALDKWLKPMGLLWWDVTINLYEDPGDVVRVFRDASSDTTVVANTAVNWIYGTATINFNVPALRGMSQRDIEKVVVHECCHILVGEMREGEAHHEERVVTGLTKAFMWVESAASVTEEESREK